MGTGLRVYRGVDHVKILTVVIAVILLLVFFLNSSYNTSTDPVPTNPKAAASAVRVGAPNRPSAALDSEVAVGTAATQPKMRPVMSDASRNDDQSKSVEITLGHQSQPKGGVGCELNILNKENSHLLVGRFVGKEEERLLKVIGQMASEVYKGSAPHVLVDVGANIGDFTIMLCQVFGGVEIHSFEPGDSTRKWLVKRTKAGCTEATVNIHARAVSDVDGEEVLLYGPSKQRQYTNGNLKPHNTGASISQGVNQGRHSGALLSRTTTTRLDTFLVHTPHLLLVKIDTEGLDPMVLRGLEGKLSTQSVDIIYFEYSKAWAMASNYTYSYMIEYLESFEYTSYVLGKDQLFLVSGDCLPHQKQWDGYTGLFNVVSVPKNSPYRDIPQRYSVAQLTL